MAHFVLIHGSWHGSWCWDRLVPLLEARGHAVSAPTLVGLAERADEATPQTGLRTHVEQVSTLIETLDRPDLVLVGHSYGGLVLVGAAESFPDSIRQLIYLDAIVADHGESAFDVMPSAEATFVRAMRTAGSAFLVPPMSPEAFGVTAADAEWLGAHLTPMPIETHRDKVEAPQRSAFTIPSTYVHCLRFGLGIHFVARAQSRGWRVVEMDAGHDVMVTDPVALADLLEQAGRTSPAEPEA